MPSELADSAGNSAAVDVAAVAVVAVAAAYFADSAEMLDPWTC